MDKINLQKLEALNNQYVVNVVYEAIKLCKPAKITVVTDLKKDVDYIRNLAILNQEKKN